MNLSQMRIMRELAERGTIAAVARHLHVTAPAISQQLAALHRELGVALTYRVGREIRLTEAGRTFLDEYEPLVAQVEERMLQQLDRGQRDALRGYLNSCRRSLATTEPVERPT